MLKAATPRRIDVTADRDPILIFTDGCWEKGYAGIGAVIIDLSSGKKLVCRGVVPGILLDRWKNMVGEHIICQIELYVMVLVRWLYKEWFRNRRTIWWVDNDAARFCIIKGLTQPEHENPNQGVLRSRCSGSYVQLGGTGPKPFKCG